MNKKFRYSNQQIARVMSEMAAYCEMIHLEFKNRAYQLAAADIAIYPESIFDLYETQGLRGLTQIPSVGAGIAKHIEEMFVTGRFPEYEDFKKKIPVNLSELLMINGVGPRTIYELWLRLKIKNITDLEKACRQGKIRKLPRFGIKSESRILKEIERLRKDSSVQS